jgi:hypothetical protein
MRTVVVLALFMLTVCAFTQTAASDITCIKKPGDAIARLSWTVPTQYENNDPLSIVKLHPKVTH